MFGKPIELTPEQKAALTERIAERRATAAARALVLPAFNAAAVCVKCGGTKVRIAFCSGGTSDAHVMNYVCYPDTAGREHLHRSCKRCGFTWYELTLDAAETPA